MLHNSWSSCHLCNKRETERLLQRKMRLGQAGIFSLTHLKWPSAERFY